MMGRSVGQFIISGESGIMIGVVLAVGGAEAIVRVWMWAFGMRAPIWGVLHGLRCLTDVRPHIGFWAVRAAQRRMAR
jgi:hypothetical protein